MAMVLGEKPINVSVQRRHWWLVAVLVLLLGSASAVGLTRKEAILVTNGQGGVALLDADTGATRFSLDDAVPAPDRSAIYRTEPSETATTLEQLDPESGQVLRSTELAGALEIRAVSPLGGAVVLMPPRPPAKGLYTPEPRERTSLNVVWAGDRSPRNYTLFGNFEPETFSTNERTLFLLEFWPAIAPDRYFVRQLDLETGLVEEVSSVDGAIQVQLNPEMRGHARAHVISPDGSFLFSLYTINSDEDPVHDPADPGGDRWAFVHTLNLREKWSHCIFLPEPFGTGPEPAISLGIGSDGRHLFVLDSGTEHVARIDARRLKVDGVELIRGLRSDQARPVAVGESTIYIGLGQTVLEMDRESLIPNAAFMIFDGERSFPVLDLELAPDGHTLRVSHGSSISVLDMPTGRVIATLTSPGRTGLSFVGASVGERSDIGVEWVIPSGG